MLHGGTAGWVLAAVVVALTACAQPDASRHGRPAFGQRPNDGFGAVTPAPAARTVDADGEADALLQVALLSNGASDPGAAGAPGGGSSGSDESSGDAATGVGHTAPPAANDPAAIVPAISEREQERRLRNAFAEDSAPVEAALALAGFLAQRERVEDALFVVDQALGRERSPELRIARAGLLRDLADVAGAARELRALLDDVGTAGMAPGTLFELAQVEWLAGHRDDARAVLRGLLQTWAGDRWLLDNRAAIDALQRSIEDGKVQDAMGVRDMLAMLRTTPQVTARLKLLDRIATPTGEAGDADRLPLRLRAIAISGGDESPAVRSRALQLAAANGIADAEYWRSALADEAALPRRIAARSCRRVLADDAFELLLARLAVEPDEAVARALHKELARAAGQPAPSTFDLGTDDGRAQAVAHWEAQRR